MPLPHLQPFTDAATAVELLMALNPWEGGNNCPAAAEAVYRYLASSGQIRTPAHEADRCFGYVVNAPTWVTQRRLDPIIDVVQGGPEGNHVVVEGVRRADDPEFTANHFFNLVRIDTSVYWLDASVTPRTAITGRQELRDMAERNRFISFRYTVGPYSVTQEPNPAMSHLPECRDVGRGPDLVGDYMRH